jgi:hypothetical protein
MADQVKIDIQTTADTSGATQTEQALSRIGKTAEKDIDSLKQLQEEMAATFAAQKARIDKVAASSPAAESGAAAGSEASLGPAAAAAAALLAVQQLQAAYNAISAAIEHGSAQAAQFSEQLRTLPSDKAQELRDRLGPVADLLEKNSGAIAEYARHSQDAEHATENFWIALSTRAIPALNELNDALKTPDATPIAESLGNAVGGAAHVASIAVKEVNSGLNSMGADGTAAATAVASAMADGVIPYSAELLRLLTAIGAATNKESEAAEAANRVASEQARINAATEATANAIRAARSAALEAQLPLEERLLAIRKRQSEAIDSAKNGDEKAQGEAAALEKQAVAIEAQIAKQKEADDQRKQSAAETNEDYRRRIQLQEFTTAGDQEGVDFLKQQIAYRQVLKATGDPDLAQRAKTAVFDEQAKRRADAEAKAKSDAEKGQAAVDKKSQQAEEAYKKEQEAIAKKREALELETRLNEAKATGNKAEEERIKWLEVYNRLREQTDSAGNSIYTDDQARRAANAQAAAQNPATSAYAAPGTKPGDIFAGTNLRRGRDQSDSSAAMAEADANMGGPGGSLLDAYNKTKGLPVGSVDGNDPTKSTNPNSSIGKGGAEDVQKAAADLAKQSEGIKSAASSLASAAKSLNGDGLAALKTAVATLTAQVQALISKV